MFLCHFSSSYCSTHKKTGHMKKIVPYKEMTVSRFFTAVAMVTKTVAVYIMSGQFKIHILGINGGSSKKFY